MAVVFCRSVRVQAALLVVLLAIAGFQQQCNALDDPQKGIFRVENQLSEQWVNVLVDINEHELLVAQVFPKEQKDLGFSCTSGRIGVIEREDGLKAEIPCSSSLEFGNGPHLSQVSQRDRVTLTAFVKDSGVEMTATGIRKIEWSH